MFNMLTCEHLGPFCTLEELAQLTASFIEFQKIHRSHIIQTGFSNQRFEESVWFDSHLTRLYYVKAPINFPAYFSLHEQSQMMYSFSPSFMGLDELNYYSLWAKPSSIKINEEYAWKTSMPHEQFKNFFYLSHYQFKNNSFYTQKGELVGELCPYSKAPYFDFIPPELAARLEGLREKLFNIRILILNKLLEILKSGNPTRLWNDCLLILKDLRGDIELLAEVANLFSKIAGIPDRENLKLIFHPYRLINYFHHNAGFEDLMWVIGHFEKELILRHLHDTKLQFNTLNYNHDLAYYFKFKDDPSSKKTTAILFNPRLSFFFTQITSPSADRLRNILDNHLSHIDSELQFYRDFNHRIESIREGKFKVKASIVDEVEIEDEKLFEEVTSWAMPYIKERIEQLKNDIKKGLKSEPNGTFQGIPWYYESNTDTFLFEGQKLKLPPLCKKLLHRMLDNLNECVNKDELIKHLYPEDKPDDTGKYTVHIYTHLKDQIHILRESLSKKARKWIKTFPRKGYGVCDPKII